MLRGINQQNIFEDNEDKDKFLDVLRDCKSISSYKVLGYCLMNNHVHLLMKFENVRQGTVLCLDGAVIL